RVDDAAVADDARLAEDDPARDLADLERLAIRDDGMARVRAALVAADEIRVLGEQVDDLALALVAPLRTHDDSGRHGDRRFCLIGRRAGLATASTRHAAPEPGHPGCPRAGRRCPRRASGRAAGAASGTRSRT